MARPTDDAQIQKLLDVLRRQGGSLGNTTLQAALGWSDDEYWRVREKAIEEGYVVRGRGRGGSLRLVEEEPAEEGHPPSEVQPAPTAIPSLQPPKESDLYEPCRITLSSKWRAERNLQDFHIEITAFQGRRATGGEWTRPDLAAISMRTFTHWPGKFFDLWTFEVKPEWELGITGVFEAAAHSRSSTHSYVLFHVSNISKENQELLNRCENEAQRFGIGLIIFSDAGDFSTWDVRVDPVRREPDPELLEQFIATQLSPEAHARLARWQK